MGFLDSLRMNGVFPTDRSNLLGPIEEPDNTMGYLKNIIGTMEPVLEKRAQDQRRHERVMNGINPAVDTPLFQEPQQPMLKQIGQNMSNPWNLTGGNPNGQMGPNGQPKNVIFKDSDPGGFKRASLGLKERELEQKGDIASGKQDVAEDRTAISQQRADIYKFKAEHPDMKIVADKGGNFHAINPLDGSSIDTGVATGSLSDKEKLEITGEQRRGDIAARGDESRKTEDVRGKNRLNEIGARVQGQIQVKGTPGADSLKPELPTQTRTKQSNKARELANTDPELAKFVKMDDGGNFTITPPGSSFFGATGPTAEQYKKIRDFIYTEPEVKDEPPKKKETTPSTDKKTNKDDKGKPAPKTQQSKFKVTVE